MDTRTKIVTAQQAARLAGTGVLVVSGYFDPLLAEHAGRLEHLKRPGVPLLVAVAEPDNPILPARARAELVAGLAVVDYVTEALDAVTPDFRLEEEDRQRREDLVAHVQRRQNASSDVPRTAKPGAARP
jgi:bifunctional ADP-heptose synthase (sugar kinase/adenylyltransferase)